MISISSMPPTCKKSKLNVILLLTLFLPVPFVVQPLHAQSGLGAGRTIFSTGTGGAVSIRYKPFQVNLLTLGSDESDNGFYIDLGARYNHPLKDWKRIKFNVFGQINRYDVRVGTDESHAAWYHFAGGISTDLRLRRNPRSKGIVITGDIGISADDLDGIALSPALAIGVYYFFW